MCNEKILVSKVKEQEKVRMKELDECDCSGKVLEKDIKRIGSRERSLDRLEEKKPRERK